MGLPAIIQRLYSFTGFQQGQGNSAFPGTQLDTDLDQTNNALRDVIEALQGIIRPDGKLANGSVTRSSLAADIRLGLGASRPWVTGASYGADDTVTSGYGLYQALSAHTGGLSFASDLAAGRWELVADLSQAVVIADNGISTAKLVDLAVTSAKIAANAITQAKIADGSISRTKAAVDLGVIPIGGEIDFAGVAPPPGWHWCNGQLLSRSSYPALFGALSYLVTGKGTVGSDTITNLGVPITGIGLVGARVEGFGVQSDTTVTFVAGNQAVLSKPIVTASEGEFFRFLPYGNGDGATNFAVPDRRGRVTAGRDDMGGPAAGRLSNPMDGAKLSNSGGSQTATLTVGQLPPFTPSGDVNDLGPHTHGIKYNRSLNGYAGGGGLGGVIDIGAGSTPNREEQTETAGNSILSFTGNPIGNGEPHSNLQPTGIANRIIFAGA